MTTGVVSNRPISNSGGRVLGVVYAYAELLSFAVSAAD